MHHRIIRRSALTLLKLTLWFLSHLWWFSLWTINKSTLRWKIWWSYNWRLILSLILLNILYLQLRNDFSWTILFLFILLFKLIFYFIRIGLSSFMFHDYSKFIWNRIITRNFLNKVRYDWIRWFNFLIEFKLYSFTWKCILSFSINNFIIKCRPCRSFFTVIRILFFCYLFWIILILLFIFR